ncbi:hypothetical protein KGF56_000197 [Candida oxycetoniae]|uniref:Vacuolar ATPase assembly protein VMA22 n=1 Tax=Candida oxycetoniae TaxID=497107 RepID=A0AAI9T1Q2_9ASCO|nr:uncharacterized protein KGF56_000197 [Candida oxycetoniae]KAI3406905.2 hypothetical protein KGF56_000197 [Candida oxycetoniae]
MTIESSIYVMTENDTDNNGSAVDIDGKTIQLLNLLNIYHFLTAKYRANFIQGFLHLSRANFQSEKLKFGLDTFDLRPYNACKVVNVGTSEEGIKYEIVDQLKSQVNKTDEPKNTTTTTIKQRIVKESTELSNRKVKASKQREEKNSFLDTIDDDDIQTATISQLRDPIYQFNPFMPPKELILSQDNFNKGLDNIIELINLQNRINALINELEKEELAKVSGH